MPGCDAIENRLSVWTVDLKIWVGKNCDGRRLGRKFVLGKMKPRIE